MPITPLHFGINGTISSLASSKFDVISCILANVLLDIQPFLVIFFGVNIQLHGISHTLFFAMIACALFFALYGFLIKKIFHIKKPLSAFIFGGTLGGILHIALDACYHQDVKPFYPFSNINFMNPEITDRIILICLIGCIIFFVIIVKNLIKNT
jgi:membrane-bound metal-dependent hydrolase YbcI (DUF457 family)